MVKDVVEAGMREERRDIEKYSEKYMESPFTKENATYRRRCVIEQMKKYLHRNILEIGCGMYPIFLYLDPDEYDTYVVVEASDVFARNAIEKIKERGIENKVKIIKGFFEEVSLDMNYDFIVCSSLIHEVDFPADILNKIYRLANLNSIIHINVPNAYSIHRILAKEMGMIKDEHELSDRNKILQQHKVYDMKSLKDQIKDIGFDVLEEGSYFFKPFTHKQMAHMLDKGIIDDLVLEGLWNLCKYFPKYGSEIYVNVKKS